MPIVSKGSNEINSIIQNASLTTGNGNLTLATTSVLGQTNTGIQQLEWISYTIIIILLLTFVMLCFYVRTYPFLAFIWILIIVFLGGLSIFLTSAYQDIQSKGGFIGDALNSWENTNSLALWLPYIIVGIGIIGGIIMFVLATRESEVQTL
jgi:hypothetical protein